MVGLRCRAGTSLVWPHRHSGSSVTGSVVCLLLPGGHHPHTNVHKAFIVEDLTMPTAMPTVFVNAGNDGPPNKPRTTGISVMGENFPPGIVVNIKAAGRRGTALVGADGNFDWDFSVRPPLGCGATVQAVVHGSDGLTVEGEGDVFCP